MSATNAVILKGGLTRDPKILENKDGSKKVLMTLAVSGGRGKYTNYISVEAFVPASFKNAQPYETLRRGAQLSVEAEMRSGQFTNEAGETVYTQTVHVTDIDVDTWGKREDGTEVEAPAEEPAADMPADAVMENI